MKKLLVLMIGAFMLTGCMNGMQSKEKVKPHYHPPRHWNNKVPAHGHKAYTRLQGRVERLEEMHSVDSKRIDDLEHGIED